MTLWPPQSFFHHVFPLKLQELHSFSTITTRHQPSSCLWWVFVPNGLPFGMTHVDPVLLTLRTYALYNCSIRVLSFMLGSGAVLAGIACVRYVHSPHPGVTRSRFSQWTLFGQKSVYSESMFGCLVGLSSVTYVAVTCIFLEPLLRNLISRAIREFPFVCKPFSSTRNFVFPGLAAAWEALFVYDCIVFFLTMRKTWRARHETKFAPTTTPILQLMFRDGGHCDFVR